MTDTRTVTEAYSRLKALVEDHEQHHEEECRSYLPFVPRFLVGPDCLSAKIYATEIQGHSGPSDLVVGGTLRSPSGQIENCVYIWELKSPQCAVFCKDTVRRVRPSSELIDAENKLLHHVYDLQDAQVFRDQFQLVGPHSVRIGGMIIGSRRTFVGGTMPREAADMAGRLAYISRNEGLYRAAGIRLCTWDDVLEQLEPSRSIIMTGDLVSITPMQVKGYQVVTVEFSTTGEIDTASGSNSHNVSEVNTDANK